jgi:dihydrodipicolinate synthase/N-acetylneuraminate lyase
MRIPEIISAVTVPFTNDGEVDNAAFRRNLERLEPVLDGVFVAGTTGEFPALESDERLGLFETALQVFGVERTIVHVGAAATRQAVDLARRSLALGARRFAAITPYYLRASVAGVADYYSALRDATAGSALYGYLFPDVAGTDVLPQDLPRLVGKSGIDGVKLSGAASARFDEYVAHAPSGFAMWSGNDADLPHVLAAGGRGTVSGVSGVVPDAWAELRESYRDEDIHRTAVAQKRVESLVAILGPSIANLKYALSAQGLGGTTCRMSIDAPDPATCAEINRLLGV